mgnify:CR=1 FL=1
MASLDSFKARKTLTAGGKTYTGRVNGNQMEGTASDKSKWSATRG